MNEKIIKDVKQECNIRERIIISFFKNLIIKVYHISRINTYNNIVKSKCCKKCCIKYEPL